MLEAQLVQSLDHESLLSAQLDSVKKSILEKTYLKGESPADTASRYLYLRARSLSANVNAFNAIYVDEEVKTISYVLTNYWAGEVAPLKKYFTELAERLLSVFEHDHVSGTLGLHLRELAHNI